MERILVVGTGTMGTGMAQACAQAGYRVFVHDLDADALSRAVEGINWSLNKLWKKGVLDEPVEEVSARIRTVDSLEEAGSAQLVLEAIREDLRSKRDLFLSLEQVCGKETIFGTNTSSIPVTDIAAGSENPFRFAGIHFFNPVHRMRLVEIVRGVMTSDDTVERVRSFVSSLNKEPVMVKRDTAGFIVNRINGMAFLEALRVLEKGIADVEDIDKAMRLGLGFPMGPFELMDMVGLDVVLAARMGIYNETREPLHYPPDILVKKAKSGQLGKKSGKGFYDWSQEPSGKKRG